MQIEVSAGGLMESTLFEGRVFCVEKAKLSSLRDEMALLLLRGASLSFVFVAAD
jgi:hypothetical protein